MNDVTVNLYVIDNQPDYLPNMLATLKEHLAIRELTFPNGEAFVQYLHRRHLSRQTIHIALISYQFSSPASNIMNGLELLEVITHTAPQIACIMLAKNSELEFTATTISAGALAVVPRSPTVGMRIINIVLRHASQLRLAIRKRQLTVLLIWLSSFVVLFTISISIFMLIS